MVRVTLFGLKYSIKLSRAEYIFIFVTDCHSRTSSTQVLVNRPTENCLLFLEVVTVCCILCLCGVCVCGCVCGCVCAETLFHSTAQASWLETHYIANNGFLFNFPSAGIVDMGYLTLKCISTAGRTHDQ